MSRSLFGPGTLVLGGGAAVLVLLLVIGFFLPAEWEARAERVIDASPEEIVALLDSPEGWRAWTPWPDSTVREGPLRGAGAVMSWDDPELGSGSFRIEAVEASSVAYTVRVSGAGDAVMITRGLVTLGPEGPATRVSWREEGDLGRNPLMGYWALSMEEAQSRELGKSLDRLAELLDEAVGSVDDPGAEGPGDTVRSGSEPSR